MNQKKIQKRKEILYSTIIVIYLLYINIIYDIIKEFDQLTKLVNYDLIKELQMNSWIENFFEQSLKITFLEYSFTQKFIKNIRIEHF